MKHSGFKQWYLFCSLVPIYVKVCEGNLISALLVISRSWYWNHLKVYSSLMSWCWLLLGPYLDLLPGTLISSLSVWLGLPHNTSGWAIANSLRDEPAEGLVIFYDLVLEVTQHCVTILWNRRACEKDHIKLDVCLFQKTQSAIMNI